MIKLIVSDMDGTLLNDEKELSPKFQQVYTKLQEKGIKFVVASGRPSYSLVPQFNFFNHNILFICDNGAFINMDEEPIVVKPLDMSFVHSIIKDARATEGVYITVCGMHTSYIEKSQKEFLPEASKYYKGLEVVDDLLELDETILKIALFDSKTWKNNSWEIWQKYNEHLAIAPSSDQWIDIMPIEVNKGMALKIVQEKLGVSNDETMAFGDYLNDLEMLKMAKYSYAMENAHPDIKNIASFVAPDNNKDGVLNTIEKVVLG